MNPAELQQFHIIASIMLHLTVLQIWASSICVTSHCPNKQEILMAKKLHLSKTGTPIGSSGCQMA